MQGNALPRDTREYTAGNVIEGQIDGSVEVTEVRGQVEIITVSRRTIPRYGEEK